MPLTALDRASVRRTAPPESYRHVPSTPRQGMMRAVRPPSFDGEWYEDWCLWVLDHGLPALPRDLGEGDAVPLARWPGAHFGAVLLVDWGGDEDDEEGRYLSSEIEVFKRTTTGWESSTGSGGGGWFSPPFEPPSAPPRSGAFWHFHASGGDDWRCCAAIGVAGSDAAWVEVEDSNGAERHQIESPLGVFIVAADGGQRAVARVLDEDGQPLAETVIAPDDRW